MIKKLILMCLAPVFLGLSIPTYANDTVHFNVHVDYPKNNPGYPYFYTDTDLTSMGSRDIRVGENFRFQTTNPSGSVQILYEQRQQQSGPLNIVTTDKNGTASVHCAGRWEHDYWNDDEGKHDRFYLTISAPCSVDPANDPSERDGGRHQSNQGYTVKAVN